MPLLSAALLPLVLLTTPVETSAPSAQSGCETGTRHLELAQETPEALAVCIRPGLSTSFLFDAKLARVELPGRERFRLIQDETGLSLVPKGGFARGERVTVRFTFQGGTDPAGVRFTLVVHPSEAARLVEVTHHPRSLDSYREGEQRARADAQQCQAEKAHLEARCSGQGGLLGLLAQGLLGEGGIADKNLKRSVTSRPGNTLTSTKAHSYRSDTTRLEGGHKVVRLAVELVLENKGSIPWMPAGAVLVGPKGEEWKVLGVWPLEPMAPGKKLGVFVELDAMQEEARGTFTLKLWSQEGGTGELFDGVTFP